MLIIARYVQYAKFSKNYKIYRNPPTREEGVSLYRYGGAGDRHLIIYLPDQPHMSCANIMCSLIV